ncbi:MAG: hypothetical protein FRX49_08580 [Trebouxia sp. A1-2]|nr:MAG: hypothetical protein FRX49_08580 [Trebouxia sp. A1-2]
MGEEEVSDGNMSVVGDEGGVAGEGGCRSQGGGGDQVMHDGGGREGLDIGLRVMEAGGAGAVVPLIWECFEIWGVEQSGVSLMGQS